MHSFRCSQCGNEHTGVPLAWGPNVPDAVGPIPPADWRSRVSLSGDDCVIDRSSYYVRGCIDLRIHGTRDVFRWLVWVHVDRRGYVYTISPWRRLLRLCHPPYDAKLDTALPYEPPTAHLPVEVRSAGPGFRPTVVLTELAHPLAIEQREGIPLERAYELAGMMLHVWERRGA